MNKKPSVLINLICFGGAAVIIGIFVLAMFLPSPWKVITLVFLCALMIGAAAVAIVIDEKRKRKLSANKPIVDNRRLTESELAACMEVLKQTGRPCIRLKPIRKPTGVFDSKFGGTPYLPPGFEYPRNTNAHSEKKPLKLLCQLNFEQLSHLPGFPKQGILQFYIAYEPNEDTYGMGCDNPTEQAGWRIVYHHDIVTDESLLQAPPVLTGGNDVFFPFAGEFVLEAMQDVMPINHDDFGWQDFVENIFEPSEIGKHLKEMYTKDEIEYSIAEAIDSNGHRIGGYPYFTQYDPRNYGKNDQYSVLLLQIDSDFEGEDEIMWGDVGVANFFITPNALDELDFSDVLYNWDCC